MNKTKRNQIIGVILVAALVLAGLGFGLIKYQYSHLQALAQKKTETEIKLQVVETAVKNADQFEVALSDITQTLAEKEATMASGDLYSWSINTMKSFKNAYKVEIPQFGPISQPAPVNLLPNFPYKQATLNVAGKAYYHEIGRFIADFENQFPLMQVVNLSFDQDPSPTAGDREKLAFRMDIVTLVRPANP